jgi:hypothetical protein
VSVEHDAEYVVPYCRRIVSPARTVVWARVVATADVATFQ